ncbi:MAG TPA: tRNA pseudouridine(54/55) synthase Pus10 [Thermoplasmata archaeon]|nr:tRNA pseudouridine(54/55) synthase Pus10 [Thermoplasmata archaeon]
MTAADAGFEITEELRAIAGRSRDRQLCRECFGRVVGRYGHGLTNPERAERLANALGGTEFAEGAGCRLCEGAFDRWETWIRRAVDAARGFEWHRFTCGSRWDPELLAREESLWNEVGSAWGESARTAFNRELGKRLGAASGTEGGTQDTDLVFLVDLPAGRVEVTPAPVYLSGRYRKLDRTLPQTRWPCRRCHGRGCETCGGTGKTYSESVEELVAGPVLTVTQGEGTRFHGMGREDIDARMLGSGRPFVLEILRPRHRAIDPPALQAEINRTTAGRVEVEQLERADPTSVARVKDASPEKSYRVVVGGAVDGAKIKESLEFATNRAIAQRTPRRVAHRRADRVRTRRIVEVRLVAHEAGRFTLELRAEAGTYVKEWVEGDDGRTDPSLAQLVGTPLKVESLDVLEIHDRE